ncbi:radical SAM protein [Sphingopyxis indica]|uniref:radical SAM protein n=1 Tax=Sphingopyxis indica TaxID=436663 RepID=UPI001FE5BEB6|nr:radical SAM protein [Sphingopyxis indica]
MTIAAATLAPLGEAATAFDSLRVRARGNDVLLIDRAGRFLLVNPQLAARYESGQLSASDEDFLAERGHFPRSELERLAGAYIRGRRQVVPGALDYLILVPTLRCNLACSYCQVSRAAIDARGHDWSSATLAGVEALVGGLTGPEVKIEFQGGEPTLRPDLIRAVIDAVPAEIQAQFIICTNLQTLNDEAMALFDRDDVQISTSLDGPLAVHSRQRQVDAGEAKGFHANLRTLLARYGPGKISALPTINPLSPPDPEQLIDSFAELGLDSIYLRPINYQGFARKRHPASRVNGDQWLAYHAAFVRRLIARNWIDRSRVLEESYFSLLLRRIFRPGEDRHVDLRNPNPIGRDYIVVDHDGCVYPTDEARMLTRAGIIDLSIGDIHAGWDTPERAALEAAATNDGDPACEACAYQPYCGRDIIDDIARYGRIDLPREETDFCRRHLYLFDLAFELIHSDDPAVQYSLRRWLGLAGETGALAAP